MPKYRDFQYRLLLDKIICNNQLVSWGIIESTEGNCEFCNHVSETVVHILFECPKVQALLVLLRDMCIKCSQPHDWSYVDYIMSDLSTKKYHIVNFISIFLKQYLYRCRCQKKQPNVSCFIRELEEYHYVEYVIAYSEGREKKHVKRWGPVMSYMRSTPT